MEEAPDASPSGGAQDVRISEIVARVEGMEMEGRKGEEVVLGDAVALGSGVALEEGTHGTPE